MRQVAIDLQNGDACKFLLENRNSQIVKLKRENIFMDSIIVEQDSVIKNDSAVRYAYINLLNVANAQTQEYKERYKIAKFNDKIKVGIGATIIVALLYAFITK